MDRKLIANILGKKDSVDLDDSIYNLRDITEDFRDIILLSLNIEEEFIVKNKRRLNAIYDILTPLLDKLTDDIYIQGYTNSKKHLAKYISDICTHISEVIPSMESNDMKKFIYHSNMLIDLVLVY